LEKGTISKRKIKLSNVDPVMQIISIHNVIVGPHCLLIVVSKLPEREDDPSAGVYFDQYQKPYNMYIYLVELEEEVMVGEGGESVVAQDLRLTPLQTFPTDYRPLSISLDYYKGIPFLFINGSNNVLHAYEIDVQTLKLHRGPHRDALRIYWETRLRFNRDKGANVSSNISMPLCLVIERAPTATVKWVGLETTAVLGYSSGLLSWTSTSVSHGVSSAPFGRVLLMDSAIMCLAFISRFKTTTTELTGVSEGEEEKTSEDGPARGSTDTTHVVVGLAEGAAILSLESVQVEATMLPSAHNHGFVRAIAVGDVTGNGYDEFVLGFEDGTVICYSRDMNAEEDEEGEEGDKEKEEDGEGPLQRQGSSSGAMDKGGEEGGEEGAGDVDRPSRSQRSGKGDLQEPTAHDDKEHSTSVGPAMGVDRSSRGQEGREERDRDQNRSMDLSRDILDASFELYDMGEGDEGEEDEDEDEDDEGGEGAGKVSTVEEGEKEDHGEAPGPVEEPEPAGEPDESPSRASSPALATPTEIWRPYHGKLAFREEWRTWLPFPIRGLAFSNHLQVPYLPAEVNGEEVKISGSRKGPKNLSVVTTKTLHCFSLTDRR
jgi:hypothetical protein